MINWDKIDKKVSVKKIISPIFLVIVILLLIVYFSIIHKYINKNVFVNSMEHIIEKNENPQFSVEKIYVCSSANAIDSTKEQKLNDLDLYQYTDIAIYLNNKRESGLTNINTIKELYIDEINIDLENNLGKTSLVYTNLLKIGSRDELNNILRSNVNMQNDKIYFNIINTNNQNNMADYAKPTFYADCSNPITLKYINQIDKKYSIEKDTSLTFDGSILQKAGIKIEDLNVEISFRINLVNNNDEYYSVCVNFKVPLNDIYTGTSIKTATTSGKQYDFFWHNKIKRR